MHVYSFITFLQTKCFVSSCIASSRNIASAVETLEQLQTYDSDDDEFFDAQGNQHNLSRSLITSVLFAKHFIMNVGKFDSLDNFLT